MPKRGLRGLILSLRWWAAKSVLKPILDDIKEHEGILMRNVRIWNRKPNQDATVRSQVVLQCEKAESLGAFRYRIEKAFNLQKSPEIFTEGKSLPEFLDRNGERIRVGAIVAAVITVNHETFKGFNFEVTVCQVQNGEMFLEGAYGHHLLSDRKPEELCIIDADTSIREVMVCFAQDFPRHH
jgi:hypothetical protein